ncbi:hypothetical protein [Streptomyces sp. NPDC016845]|uniref:hypothetical protein n=1 Tax=Streptomyces sp. NPDC016845 TaxID=3364972 RepID=UPI00379E5D1E
MEELERREWAIRQRVEELRLQVAELGEQLEGFEEMLARVDIARQVVREILDDAAADQQERAGRHRAEMAGPIGVTTVPMREAGTAASVLPSSYRDIMEVLQAAGRPMRSKAVSVAIGWGDGASKVESVRVKLKRLASRGWLSEDSPGLFAMVAPTDGFGPGDQDSGG